MEFQSRFETNKISTEDIQNQSFPEENSTPDTVLLSSENQIVDKHALPSVVTSSIPKQHNWRKDKFSIALLLFLYLLQGIPLGLAASLSLIIQTHGANWSQQATFSLALWPFSIKLLWAPIVDALYFKNIGRRKSWLIPTQYLIGIVMIVLSYHIDRILLSLSTASNNTMPIYVLTAIFFGLSFLAATQDICVDGWALSMLERENIGWASTCNSVGQNAGMFIGRVIFLTLESKDFTNKYIRKPLNLPLQSNGLITITDFLLFWGIVFIISTTLIGAFKRENDQSCASDEPHFGLFETYKVLLKVLCLPSVRSLALILLTIKIGFAATDVMTHLELIDRGVTKETLALLSIPLTPLHIVLPFLIAKCTTGPKPLNIFVVSYPPRIVLGIVFAVFVYFTPAFQHPNKTFPWYYYALALVISCANQIVAFNMFVSLIAFFARISDPKIGGTYMTLLNTLTNLGGSWVSTVALYAADYLQWKTCSMGNHRCETKFAEEKCASLNGVCRPYIDSYYTEVTICTVAGILWLVWKYRTIMRLQSLPESAWQVGGGHRGKKETLESTESPTEVSTAL